VVKVSGPADAASVRALTTQLEALAQQRGTLRILVDQTDMQPGLLGFSDMAEMVSDWRKAPGLRTLRCSRVAHEKARLGISRLKDDDGGPGRASGRVPIDVVPHLAPSGPEAFVLVALGRSATDLARAAG
jgi:hypothetical protein